MPKFSVDVKAFITVTVEAPNEHAARRAADLYVETSCSPAAEETRAWAEIEKSDGAEAWPLETGGFSVDGYSEAEACDED